MMQLFVECRGVFQGRKVLLACLVDQFPDIWRDSLNSVGTTYSRLAKRLAHTRYRLVPPKRGGIYGIELRLERAIVTDHRLAPLKHMPDVFVVPRA